ATNLDRSRQEIDRSLQVLPIKLTKIGRTATYGSWFNFYLCHFKATVKVPGVAKPIKATYGVSAKRCSLAKEVA
ncbi:MCE family protein, partial [Nocardioides sp. GCM10030258]